MKIIVGSWALSAKSGTISVGEGGGEDGGKLVSIGDGESGNAAEDGETGADTGGVKMFGNSAEMSSDVALRAWTTFVVYARMWFVSTKTGKMGSSEVSSSK